jgi:hypothetical protein
LGFGSLSLQLPQLSYLYLDAACADCAPLLRWFTLNPGCAVDVNCTDPDVDRDHQFVCYILYHYAVDKLDVTDKCLKIDLAEDAITLLVWQTSPPPDLDDFKPIFRFATFFCDSMEGGPGEDDDCYRMLALLVRAAYNMELTKFSELYLNVDVDLPLEDNFALILGPLIRKCKNAKKLVLEGKKNEFMTPVLLAMMNGTGSAFDDKMFFGIDKDDGKVNAEDQSFWSFAKVIDLTTQIDLISDVPVTGPMGDPHGRT